MSGATAAVDGPHYVPPPPPRWLLPALGFAVLIAVAAAAVGLDLAGGGDVGGSEAVEADTAVDSVASLEPVVGATVTDDDLAALIAAVEARTDQAESDAAPDDASDGVQAFVDHDGVWIDPASSGRPWSALGAVEGLLTFRGNPTRSYHGRGPVPTNPEVLWRAEIGCSVSFVGREPKEWCGTGWTGQPLVFRPPGADGFDDWWVAVGGYNRAVNFFDPDDGSVAYPPFVTGDIIKGTATVDPDGYPLIYTGSRDDSLHVVALDRAEPTELWALSSDVGGRTLWNNDWDGSPLVIDDLLIVGGENSRFYVVKLNRGYGGDGLVTIDPELVASIEGWDQELLDDLGDVQVSIENSVVVIGSVVYFANSGGLVQGWDLAPVADGGEPVRAFRYWVGDDVDASLVVDDDGQLYVGAEFERGSTRARELGQVFRLDPADPDDPLVWSIEANAGIDTGVWATPALHGDLVLVSTDDGRVLGIDRDDGAVRWTVTMDGPLWSSPVIVDDILIQADCTVGVHAFDMSDPGIEPRLMWTVPIEGCVESTPAVWDGQIFVGSRNGFFYGIGEPSATTG